MTNETLNNIEKLETDLWEAADTRPRIARRELATLPLLLPPRQLQEHFRTVAEPLNLQRAHLYQQNEKLRAARDLLLPRLMSGEIAV